MSWRLSVWDALQCDSGVRLAEIHPLASGRMELNVTADEQLTFLAPRFDASTGTAFEWVSQIDILRVIRAENRTTGDVYEWRVAAIDDVRTGDGKLLVSVTADPVLFDLRRALVKVTTTGGATFRNLGGINTSIAQYVDTYVLTAATDAGMSWWSRGTITNSEGVDLAWDGYTALELLFDLADDKNLEVRARRNGTSGYYIDVLTITDTTTTKPHLDVDRNVKSLTRRRKVDGWANVIIPRGKVSAGAVDFSDIGDNHFNVKSTGTYGGSDYVIIEDPQGYLPILAFDDQVNGLYLEADLETTRVEITDSEPVLGLVNTGSGPLVLYSATLYVSDNTDFAAGDRVRIVADSSGTLLTELTKPDSTYPEVRGFYSRPDQRTEANYLVGTSFAWPMWADHADQQVLAATIDGTHSSTTTINLKDLPEGTVIDQYDLVGDTNGTWDATVASGGGDTVGSDGKAQLTVSAVMSATDGDIIPLVIGMKPASGSLWPGVSYTHSNTAQQGIFIRDHQALAGVYAAATYNGVHNGAATFDIDGLAADTLYPGPMWFSADGSTYSGRWIVGGFLTDGSGAATITCDTSFATHLDGAACGLWWPDFSGARSSQHIALTSVGYVGGADLDLAPFGVRYTPGRSTLYVGFGVSHWGEALSFVESGTNVYLTPGVDIGVRALGSAGAYSTTESNAAAYSTALNTVLHVDHTGSVALTQDSDVYVRFKMPRHDSATTSHATVNTRAVAIRYICAWLGPDQEAPLVEGSYANGLWYLANQQLDESGTPPVTYSLTLADLTELVDFDVTTEKLVLGTTMVVKDRDMGVEASVRLVGIEYDLSDPMRSKITLDRTPPKATRQLLPARWSSRRPEDDSSLSVEGVGVRPAVRETAALRIIPPSGPSSSGGSVTPAAYS